MSGGLKKGHLGPSRTKASEMLQNSQPLPATVATWAALEDVLVERPPASPQGGKFTLCLRRNWGRGTEGGREGMRIVPRPRLGAGRGRGSTPAHSRKTQF